MRVHVILQRFSLAGTECIYTISSFARSYRLTCGKAIGERGSENCTTSQKGCEDGLPFQTSHVAVKVVLVTRNRTGIGVLPESVVTPPIRQSADTASIASDPQRAVGSERGAVTSTSGPPIGGGIDHRETANAGMVCVGEIADPTNH